MRSPEGEAKALANLKAGDMTGVERDGKGRFESSRAERGRQHALEILEDPTYKESLKKRMIAGEAGPIEVWVWRIGYGDPPRAREDDSDDQERFDRLRKRLRAFMKESPEEARTLAGIIAKQRQLPEVPREDPATES